MSEQVYVIGHRNPDTDSVASAIAYAYLKNAIQEEESSGEDDLSYVPMVLGAINKETRFVLDNFGIKAPARLDHIKIRARDAMSSKLITATPQTLLRDVGDLFCLNNIRSVPVVDQENCPQGIVTERNIAHRYFEEVQVRSLAHAPLSVERIVETLHGELIAGNQTKRFSANVIVAAMQAETMKDYIESGDIVIVGNREDAQELAIKQGASCLVITGNLRPGREIEDLAEKNQTVIILTELDTFATAKRINLSTPVEEIMEKDFLIARDEELFYELVDDVLNSEDRLVLIVDEHNHLLGIITRQDLVHPRQRKAILVDHNEISQSAAGIEEAQILEIVDHHRLGDIQTGEPILVINEPVGATSTIVFKKFKQTKVEIPEKIAGIMLAAILSDSVLMKSPTTTEEDKAAVHQLADYIGVDAMDFGVDMYREASDVNSISALDLVLADLKAYDFNDIKLGIAQLETIDLDSVLTRKEEILAAMDEIKRNEGFYGLIFMVTDILQEGTELLVVGKTKIAEKAFNKKLTAGSMFLPGVISRKKQVAPPLAKVLVAK